MRTGGDRDEGVVTSHSEVDAADSWPGAAFRKMLILVGALPWLLFGCAAFESELPQIGYELNVPVHGSAAECYKLASLFENETALRINPYRPPALPAGQYCDVTLSDTYDGYRDEVTLLWDWHAMDIVASRYGGLGIVTPNERTTRLANELVAITRAHYGNTKAKQFEVFDNPFFRP